MNPRHWTWRYLCSWSLVSLSSDCDSALVFPSRNKKEFNLILILLQEPTVERFPTFKRDFGFFKENMCVC